MKNLNANANFAVSLRTVLVFLAAFVCHIPQAAEQNADAYRMAAISDAAYGEDLLLGQYERLIGELGGKKVRQSERFVVHNNLCVAYVLAKDLDNARRACDVAVKTSARSQIAKHVAVALTNRGVIYALSGDTAAARRDFKAAIKARRNLAEPNENLMKLETRDRAALAAL